MARVYDERNLQLLSTLFILLTPRSKSPLVIDGIDVLTIDEQLEIVKPENISTQQLRRKVTFSLYDKVPKLRYKAHKRTRFKSILASYYRSYVELETLSMSSWDKNQLVLSLFIHFVQQLQIKPNGDKEKIALMKLKKNASHFWEFIYFFLQYCHDFGFQGRELHEFYKEITNDGKKNGGFGLKFVQKICATYSLKFGRFAKVKRGVGVWVTKYYNKPQRNNPATTEQKEESTNESGDLSV